MLLILCCRAKVSYAESTALRRNWRREKIKIVAVLASQTRSERAYAFRAWLWTTLNHCNRIKLLQTRSTLTAVDLEDYQVYYIIVWPSPRIWQLIESDSLVSRWHSGGNSRVARRSYFASSSWILFHLVFAGIPLVISVSDTRIGVHTHGEGNLRRHILTASGLFINDTLWLGTKSCNRWLLRQHIIYLFTRYLVRLRPHPTLRQIIQLRSQKRKSKSATMDPLRNFRLYFWNAPPNYPLP